MKNWIAKVGQVINAMSKKQKIIALVAAVVVAGGGTGVGIWATHQKPEPQPEPVKKEVVKEEEVVEEEPQVIVEAAVPVTMTGESMEKDLKVKLAGTNGKSVSGVAFKVLLVPTDKDKAMSAWNTKLAEVNEKYPILADIDQGKTQLSEQEKADEKTETDTSTDSETVNGLTLEEAEAVQAREEAYTSVLSQVKGDTYSDDDKDGYIHITDLEPKDYDVWYVPVEGYSTAQRAIKVNVKEKVEYKKVDVEDKVEAYSAAQDTQQHATVTESVTKDTVEWVDSTKTKHEAVTTYEKSTTQPVVQAMAGDKISATTADGVVSLVASGSATVYNVSGANTITLPFELSDNVGNAVAATSASATSVNGAIANASVSGNAVVVNAAQTAGTTNVDLVCATGNGEVGLSIVITNADMSVQLVNASGEALYKDDKGTAAMIADYNPSGTYYVANVEPEYYTYTGWQTVDGKVYYYDKNEKPVTGEQTIAGTTYHFDSEGALVQGTGKYGIDVSKWQGNIDWNAVKNAGISYAIVRCGYRGSSTHGLAKDPYFEKYVSGANAVGIRVGIYFYSRAVNPVEAVEEASYTLQLIGGKKISYPVFIDMESTEQNGLSTEERTNIAIAFCETIRNSGYTPGVYANYNWMTTKLNMSSLNKYCVWIARYNNTLGYSGKYDIWQHTSKGQVPGISGNVDMNLSYMSY